MLFKHNKVSENYTNRIGLQLYTFPIMGTLWLWTTEFNILIQITGSILSIAIIFFFYKKPPFVYDKINLTQTKLHITHHTGYFFIFSQKTTSQTYTVSKMESFKSTSKLIIQMKNEEKVVINYHE